ncbi:putative DNA-binding protein [Lacticaseibacillus zhaodongensis]|uniref:putative DNA-binding protein n=1 Tax=Lacticaseibacillus zhaodongensis TaxID=2668065 RepID=UPI0012D2B682|nr:putative DNA-binding protein [Lacticaseibacillus zhaodongensis]
MELAKTNRMNNLFAFYKELLTKKQQEYLELYYGDDYSLGEIAADAGVSRQAVYDNIKRSDAALEEYEGKLHLLAKYEASNDAVDALSAYVHEHYSKDNDLRHLLGEVQKQVAQ